MTEHNSWKRKKDLENVKEAVACYKMRMQIDF